MKLFFQATLTRLTCCGTILFLLIGLGLFFHLSIVPYRHVAGQHLAVQEPTTTMISGSPPRWLIGGLGGFWLRGFLGGSRSDIVHTTAPTESNSCSGQAHALVTPKHIKLYYGDMAIWRGECIRICLFIGGIPFDDIRNVPFESLKSSGKLTFGEMPVMEVDGQVLSTVQAMASYSSKLAGMAPSNPWLAAKVDEAINGCQDVTETIGTTFGLPEEEKVAKMQKLIAQDGRLTMQMRGIETILIQNGKNGHVAGQALTVADIAVWSLTGYMSGGFIHGIPRKYIAQTFPNVDYLWAKVDVNPKIEEWKLLHSKNYESLPTL